MRTYTVQGIILKRKNVGEADRLLTVFTREQGKIQIKAKGVRKIASKRASHIEPLNKTSLTIYKGVGTAVLTEASALDHFTDIKTNLEKVGFAYHICELVDGLCPENQENEAIFALVEDMLTKLSYIEDIAPVIHEFELELLRLLGYYSEGTYDLRGAKASYFIESILERKLKTRQMLLRLTS